MGWRALRHPNVLPLLGVTTTGDQGQFVMVSKWMVGGNINKFVEANPNADRFELVCFSFRALLSIYR